MQDPALQSFNSLSVFNTLPGCHLVLLPDAPRFTIVAATDDYLVAAMQKREQVAGQGVFETFTDDPANLEATGVKNLRSSLEYVVKHRSAHHMADQRYDIQNPGTGAFERRVWSPQNKPVLNEQGEVQYIIHTVEDISEKTLLKETEEYTRQKLVEVVAINADVTEQVTMLKLVEENEQELRALVLQAPIGICIMDAATLVSQVANESFAEIAGRPMNEIVGWMYWDTFKEARPYYEEALSEVIREGVTYRANEVEVPLLRHGKQETVHVTFVYEPLKDTDGKVQKVVVWVLDNTPQVVIRKSLQESEARYRNLFESMDQGFCIIDMIFDENQKAIDYRFMEINPVFEKETGLKNATGKTARELIPDLEDRWLRRYGGVAITGEPTRFNEGSQAMGKWFDVFAFRPGADGSTRVALLFTNITEQKKAQEAILQSERNLRNMILQAPVAMGILKGPDFIVEIANERLYELWGRPKEEMENKSVFAALPEAKNQGFEEILTSVYTTGKSFSAIGIPVNLPRRQGIETIYIDLLYEPFREGDGRISGVTAVALDVTEQIAARHQIEHLVEERTRELAIANSALRKSNEDLSRSNANLEEFAYAASHDMKEPIRKIHFFADRLKGQLSGKLSQAETRDFGRMETAAQRMGTLIDDLLLYSHISRGTRLEGPVDLNDVVKQVLEDLELDIAEKRALIHMEKLPVINGNKRQLQQLFQNLLSNALKYNRPDTPPRVAISCSVVDVAQADGSLVSGTTSKRFYEIVLQDNGIGFEQEDSERIFQVFTRLHANNIYKGTGVGLSIVRKAAENHGGHIVAEASPGEGAMFRVFLPVPH
jgi:PAS domain S-box-containing protein